MKWVVLYLPCRILFVIFLFTVFTTDILAQKNADGTYSLRTPDGTVLIYYPTRPCKTDKAIDSLAVEGLDGAIEIFYRVSENGSKAGSLQGTEKVNIENQDIPKITNDDGTVTEFFIEYPNCDCEIDTLRVEQPDGSIKQYYTIKSGNKNILKKEIIIDAANKTVSIDVYQNAEMMPKFKAGKNELTSYIRKNIRFNNNGKRYLGALNIHFIVLKNGKIENINIDKEYSTVPPALEKDLKRVLKNMPAWKPGKVNGTAVNAYYTLQMNLVI